MITTTLVASAAVAALALGGSIAAGAGIPDPDPDVIVIDALGLHNAPEQWFADAALVPGDGQDRTILIRNDLPNDATVSVVLDDVEAPVPGSMLADLRLRWGDSSASIAEVAINPPTLVDEVTLARGEDLSLSLGAEYGRETTRIPTTHQALSFNLVITVTDPSEGRTGAHPGDGASGGSGDLAKTGGELGQWWPWALAAVGVGLWLVAARRRTEPDNADSSSACEPST